MPNGSPISTALIAAGSVVIGALIGLFSEWIRRRWADQDFHRGRNIQVLERRCDHAEELARVTTATFFDIYRRATFIAASADRKQVLAVAEGWVKRWFSFDTDVHVGGPAILSMDDLALTEAWYRMGDLLGDLAKVMQGIAEQAARRTPPKNVEALLNQADDLKRSYHAEAAKFYRRLDSIRKVVT